MYLRYLKESTGLDLNFVGIGKTTEMLFMGISEKIRLWLNEGIFFNY